MKPTSALVTIVMTTASLAQAHPGIGIVSDSRGNVYFTDLKQVWMISTDGRKQVVVPAVHTHELYVDGQDRLYGAHLWYEGERTGRWGHYVWRRDPGGKLEKIIPPRPGFLEDYSFVRDAAGNMYWADRGSPTRIRRRAPSGAIEAIAEGQFRNVRWMAAAPDGIVYLVDYQDLVRISRNGQIAVVARNLANHSRSFLFSENQHAVMGLAPDGKGNVYLAVAADRAVKKVTAAGQVTVAARSSYPWSPTGVLPAGNGDLWILEDASPLRVRVRLLRSGGGSVTY